MVKISTPSISSLSVCVAFELTVSDISEEIARLEKRIDLAAEQRDGWAVQGDQRS